MRNVCRGYEGKRRLFFTGKQNADSIGSLSGILMKYNGTEWEQIGDKFSESLAAFNLL